MTSEQTLEVNIENVHNTIYETDTLKNFGKYVFKKQKPKTLKSISSYIYDLLSQPGTISRGMVAFMKSQCSGDGVMSRSPQAGWTKMANRRSKYQPNYYKNTNAQHEITNSYLTIVQLICFVYPGFRHVLNNTILATSS